MSTWMHSNSFKATSTILQHSIHFTRIGWNGSLSSVSVPTTLTAWHDAISQAADCTAKLLPRVKRKPPLDDTAIHLKTMCDNAKGVKQREISMKLYGHFRKNKLSYKLDAFENVRNSSLLFPAIGRAQSKKQ
eukprot:724366-Amphidinium_carterae.1